MEFRITDRINHPAIYNAQVHTNFLSYQNFLNTTPVLQTYNDQRCRRVTAYFTNEIHRKSWLTMVVLNYDVRDHGYTLSAQTFENTNMVIVNGCDLKFYQLWGTIDESHEQSCPDFICVSNKITEACQGIVFNDVNCLLSTLASPISSYNKVLNKCNYALMPNTMRRTFLMWLWENSQNPNIFPALRQACYNYDLCMSWRGDVCSVRGSPIELVFNHLNNAYPGNCPTELQKFIRHALVHLTDNKHGYSPDEALFIIHGYLEGYMSTAQQSICCYGGLAISDLEKFAPQAF